jgi:predicted Zn finger-like uncharacterized protein
MHESAPMDIACPQCATRYVVPDSAIGTSGRTIRCAQCRESWFQGPPDAEGSLGESLDGPSAGEGPAFQQQPDFAAAAAGYEDEAPSGDVTADADDESYANGEPTTFPVPADEGPAVWSPANDVAGEFGAVDDEEADPSRRRGSVRLWAGITVGFAVAVAAIAGAASVWGMPEWVPIGHSAFSSAPRDLVLRLPAEQQDRRMLANGAEFFGASGSITNVGRQTRRVPPILIVLRDDSDRVVYRWEVSSPKRALAPGESVTINEAVTDVPRSAKVAEIGWKPS